MANNIQESVREQRKLQLMQRITNQKKLIAELAKAQTTLGESPEFDYANGILEGTIVEHQNQVMRLERELAYFTTAKPDANEFGQWAEIHINDNHEDNPNMLNCPICKGEGK